MTRIIVVGAGIAGLAAAHRLTREARPDLEVVVLESAPEVGGKLRSAPVAGVSVDVGAEAMLNRRPEGVDLARAAGCPISHPTVVASQIYSRGALRPLPRSLMGIPLDVEQLRASGVLSDAGMAAVLAEPGLPPLESTDDVSVGDLVADRLGPEVVDRLVEPLLGGVYAGHAHELSARACVPQVLAWAVSGSFLEQAAAIPTTYDLPVFATVTGGMGTMPGRIVDQGAEQGRFRVETGVTVRELRAAERGWELVTGPASAPELWTADHVILATPAAPTARLLSPVAPTASRELGRIGYASTAVVTFAIPADRVPHLAELEQLSGMLIPPIEGRRIKASTFSFAKWGWVRDAGRDLDLGGLGSGRRGDVLFLRTSLGRRGEEVALQASDEELIRWSLAELAELAGIDAPPLDVHVQRWGGGLPQYAVGHLDLVARVRASVRSASRPGAGLAVCGAAYDGVGIPAVIDSAQAAAEQIEAALVPSAAPGDDPARSTTPQHDPTSTGG